MKRIIGCNKTLFIIIALAITVSSCTLTRTSVGSYKESNGKEYTYAKGKQLWILWGIFPLTKTNVSTPSDGVCEVITKFNFTDGLITSLTGGIVTSYTVKVKAKKKQ